MGVAWGIRHTAGPDSLSISGAYPASPPSLAPAALGDWHALVADTLGPGSNNQAEYHALLGGLRHAHRLGVRRLVVVGDSMLVVKQVNGQWKTKSGDLKPLVEEAGHLACAFKKFRIRHVSRQFNQEIDSLSRLGPLVKGDTGFSSPPGGNRGNSRFWTGEQAAWIKWAWITKKLTLTEIAEVWGSDPSTVRKCAAGWTYDDIGKDDL